MSPHTAHPMLEFELISKFICNIFLLGNADSHLSI